MRIVLLEAELPENIDANDKIIALTPAACHACKNAKIDYAILSDFFSQHDIHANQSEYFDQQLVWMEGMDQFLDLRDENGQIIRPGKYHFSKLKYLCDTVTLYVVELKLGFEVLNPDSVLFVGKRRTEDVTPLPFDGLESYAEYIYPQIIKYVCENLDVPFTCLEQGVLAISPAKVLEEQTPSGIKRVLKALLNFWRYQKKIFTQKSAPNILFLDAGVEGVDRFIRALMGKARVRLKQGKIISKLYQLAERSELLSPFPVIEDSDLMPKVAAYLESGQAYEIYTQKAGLPMRRLIEPILNDFLHRVMPDFLNEYGSVLRYIQRENISQVVARGSSGNNYPAALNAAENLEGVNRLCLQHSCGPLDWKDWMWGEFAPFDQYLTTDPVSTCAFRDSAERYRVTSEYLLEYPTQLKELESKGQNKDSDASQSKTVLFVPRKRPLWREKYNTYFYPTTWYYELHKQIFDFFKKHPDWTLLYKHTSALDWEKDTLLRDFESCENIKVVGDNPVSYFPSVSHVLVDHPSTTLFQAAAFGLPVLSLYHNLQSLLPGMGEFWGRSLAPIQRIEDGVSAIAEFVQSEQPDCYQHDFEFRKQNDDSSKVLAEAFSCP